MPFPSIPSKVNQYVEKAKIPAEDFSTKLAQDLRPIFIFIGSSCRLHQTNRRTQLSTMAIHFDKTTYIPL